MKPCPNFEWLLGQLREANLDPDHFVLTGSAVLAVRGIRDVHDLDLILTPELWRSLTLPKEANYMGGESQCIRITRSIQAFDFIDVPGRESRFVASAQEVIREAERIDGLRYQNIGSFLRMKEGMGRRKDRLDLHLLRSFNRV